jgi:hypothetical protein
MLIAWTLIGALIGAAAAQKKGFSMVGGVIGGLLLGPLAFLMFLVSGVSSSDQNKKCPHCAEWVKAEATICKHCHQPLTRTGPPTAARVESRRPGPPQPTQRTRPNPNAPTTPKKDPVDGPPAARG